MGTVKENEAATLNLSRSMCIDFSQFGGIRLNSKLAHNGANNCLTVAYAKHSRARVTKCVNATLQGLYASPTHVGLHA